MDLNPLKIKLKIKQMQSNQITWFYKTSLLKMLIQQNR